MKTLRIQALVLMASTVLSSACLAADQQKPVPFNVLITSDAIQYVLSKVPQHVRGPLAIPIPAGKLLGIPPAVKPVLAASRFEGESHESYSMRAAESKLTLADISELAPELSKVQGQVDRVNRAFEKLADRCARLTGTRLCLQVDYSLLNNSRQAAARLVSGQAQVVIFAPDQYRMLSEPTKGLFGRVSPPVLDPQSVVCREIPLHLPELPPKTPRFIKEIAKTDLGPVYACWQKDDMAKTLRSSEDALVEKARDQISKGVDWAGPKIARMTPKDSMTHVAFANPLSRELTKRLVTGIGKNLISGMFDRLEHDVFEGEAFDREKLARVTERDYDVKHSVAGQKPSAHGAEIATNGADVPVRLRGRPD